MTSCGNASTDVSPSFSVGIKFEIELSKSEISSTHQITESSFTFAQTFIMRLFLAATFLLSLGITSCSNDGAKTESTTTTAEQAAPAAPQSKLSDSATAQLMNVVTDYYQLKDAFVATDAAKADEAAKKLAQSTEKMKTAVKGDSSVGANVLPYLDTVSMSSEKLLAEQDPTIEKKRAHFEKVSDAMYVLLKNVELKNAGVYRQFCPMAFDDKGAYWLSNENEIRNPYFGKKMLECGEVTDSLK